MSIPSSIAPPLDLTKIFSIEAGKDQPADRAKIAAMAQEFEAMLMLQMVRQMRQSLLMEEEEQTGLGSDTMTDTFDVEFARYLTKAGGIGLQQMIERHVSEAADKNEGGEKDAAGADSSAAVANAPSSAATLTAMARSMVSSGVGPTAIDALSAATTSAASSGAAATTSDTLSAARIAMNAASAASSSSAFLPRRGEEDLVMPLDAGATSGFGWRADPLHGRRKFHAGVDLRAAYGTEVPAAGAGTVTFAGERGGYGLMVVVGHQNGVETRYAHLASADVQAGQSITAGQVVGRVGSSGRSTGPHLHFEVLRNGERVDPTEVAVRQAVEAGRDGS